MLALLVHEFRSPIAVVNGYLGLLLRKRATQLTGADRKLLEDAARGCERLMGMLQQLDDLADLEAGDPLRSPVPVPIFELCGDAVRTASRAGSVVEFLCEAGDRRAHVLGDADRLSQAFSALTAVSVREHREQPVEVCGFISREDGVPRAVVTFAGRGTGRPDFSIGRRGDVDLWQGGTGLALPIASRIIHVHGGQFWSLPGVARAARAVALPLTSA